MNFFQKFLNVENLWFEHFVWIFPTFVQIGSSQVYSLVSIFNTVWIDEGYDNKLKIFLEKVKFSVVHQKIDHSFEDQWGSSFSWMLSCHEHNTFCWVGRQIISQRALTDKRVDTTWTYVESFVSLAGPEIVQRLFFDNIFENQSVGFGLPVVKNIRW